MVLVVGVAQGTIVGTVPPQEVPMGIRMGGLVGVEMRMGMVMMIS